MKMLSISDLWTRITSPMTQAELRQHFYQQLSAVYFQGELQALYHWCVSEIAGWSRTQAYMHNLEDVPEKEKQRWDMVIGRLGTKEPVQYIFNKAFFFDMELYVDKNVLIPRPETEELVELLLNTYEGQGMLSVADIGTGSGCITLALKKARPGWRVMGCDVSKEALEVAKRNAEQTGVEAEFLHIDITKNGVVLPEGVDIIVSNPPYIPADRKHTLEANVIDFEPTLALFAPEADPFYFFRRITEVAVRQQAKAVFFETHAKETGQLVEILKTLWPGSVHVVADITGKERFVVMQKQ